MRTIPDKAASGRVGPNGVATWLACWQAGHDADALSALVEILHDPLVRLVAHTLRHVGIRDPGVRDDVVAAVLERLYRLGAADRPGRCSAFDPGRVSPNAGVDPGWAFVRCIARSMAHDAARAVRRRDRLAAGYAMAARESVQDECVGDVTDVEALHAAMAALDERSRQVVELLLDGRSQVVIAHLLGVCEGTVSRVRTRAIARLKAALLKKTGGGGASS